MSEVEPINLDEEVHSKDAVMAVLNKHLEGKEYHIVKERFDEQGLYFLKIIIPGEDGISEYVYTRKGRYPEGQSTISSVYVAFYNTDGLPVGGSPVANWENGEWMMIS